MQAEGVPVENGARRPGEISTSLTIMCPCIKARKPSCLDPISQITTPQGGLVYHFILLCGM